MRKDRRSRGPKPCAAYAHVRPKMAPFQATCGLSPGSGDGEPTAGGGGLGTSPLRRASILRLFYARGEDGGLAVLGTLHMVHKVGTAPVKPLSCRPSETGKLISGQRGAGNFGGDLVPVCADARYARRAASPRLWSICIGKSKSELLSRCRPLSLSYFILFFYSDLFSDFYSFEFPFVSPFTPTFFFTISDTPDMTSHNGQNRRHLETRHTWEGKWSVGITSYSHGCILYSYS